MGQRAAPAPFLKKTYQLVDDPETDDVVTWNENGTTFVVRETADFSRDLLPKYFKHNNFSSFVRQLNTYGFRKIVPDKWEFANDNFKRGEKELLSRIHRRKIAISPPQDGKTTTTACDQLSPSNSDVDLGSTSTSSPDSKRANFADLSNENNRLKRDNEMLVSELSQTKKKCDELMNLLKKYINVGPRVNENDENNDNDENENEGEDGMKLFGVWVKGNGKKRGRDANIGSIGVERKEIKTSKIDTPWMKITSPRGETSSVYN